MAQVRLARALEQMPLTADALAQGEVSSAAVGLLVVAQQACPEAFAGSEGWLVEAARTLSFAELRSAVAYWRQAADREGAELEEERRFERRRLHVSPMLDGMVRVDGDLDPETGQTLITALRAVQDADVRTGPDLRSPGQRRADALGEVCRRWLDSVDRPSVAGERPHVVVTIALESLSGRLGRRCELEDAGTITPEVARRWACDANVSRVITDARSEPLDVGRRTRVVPPPLRRAVAVRDRGCAFPSCDRPPGWCDAHHVRHWADGGETTLENLVLLCRAHHRVIHNRGFGLAMREGRPAFSRPDGSPLTSRAPPQGSISGFLQGHPRWRGPGALAMMGSMLDTPVAPVAPAEAPLRRRASHRLVAGVAGGLADYYRTRPIWFRLLFGGSALATLLAALMDDVELIAILAFAATAVYLLLWWLVPREDLPESAAQRLGRRYPSAGRWPGLILLGIGLAVLLAQLGVWRGDVVVAFALIGAGVLLYRREESSPRVEPAERPPTATIAQPLPLPLPPRERSALGWMTIGVAMLVVGGALIWANAADATPRLVGVPALALLVVSAGLLIGTVYGRARWLVLPAILLVPIVLMTSVVRLPLEGRFGGLNASPGTLAEAAGPYRVSVGRISIDLTQFEEQDVFLTLSASAAIGDIWIVVPYDAHVVAQGYTGYGSVQVGDEGFDSGIEVSFRSSSEPRWGDGMTVDLTLEAGLGSVNVYRDYPTRRELRELKAERRAGE